MFVPTLGDTVCMFECAECILNSVSCIIPVVWTLSHKLILSHWPEYVYCKFVHTYVCVCDVYDDKVTLQSHCESKTSDHSKSGFQVAKAFWMAIGGDEEEIDGLSSGEES